MVQRFSIHASSPVAGEQVRAVAVDLLTESLPLQVTGYAFTDADIYSLVVAAAAGQRSLESASRQWVAGPSANLARHYLAARVLGPLSITELEARCNTLLASRLPPGLVGQDVRLAIDLTLLPYYGAYGDEPGELRRGPAKAGTTRFHAYASAYVIRQGKRVTLALAYVYAEDTLLDVVEELLARVRALRIGVQRLYLDREFASVAILRFLHAQPFSSIIPIPKRGRALTALLTGPRSSRTTYTMRSAEEGELTFPLWIAVRYAMARRGRSGREYLPFAVVGPTAAAVPVLQIADEYRQRFGIESSYRLLHQGRARTTSRDPGLRLLWVTIGFLLTNLWVWLKATLLAHTARRDRAAARAWLDAHFRLDQFRHLLLAAVATRFLAHAAIRYPFRLPISFSLSSPN